MASITLKADKTSGYVGETFTFSGKYTPDPGQPANILLRIAYGDGYESSKTATSDGSYSFSYAYKKAGTFQVVVWDPIKGTHSPFLTITVKAKTHSLTVESEPTGITFTINDVQASTPYSAELQEGDYTIRMPAEWNGWRFKQWEDGSPIPIRSITLTADTSMKATYERVAPAVPWHIVVPIALGLVALIGVGVWYYKKRKASKKI
jgi:hypothetical protein